MKEAIDAIVSVAPHCGRCGAQLEHPGRAVEWVGERVYLPIPSVADVVVTVPCHQCGTSVRARFWERQSLPEK